MKDARERGRESVVCVSWRKELQLMLQKSLTAKTFCLQMQSFALFFETPNKILVHFNVPDHEQTQRPSCI